MKLIVRFIACIAAIIIMNFLFPQNVIYENIGALLIFSGILSLVYTLIRPFLQLISIPITCLTLGFFSLVINGGLVKFTSMLVPGFEVVGFWSFIGVSVIISIIEVLIGYKKIDTH